MTKPIAVIPDNYQRILELLKAVNGHSRAHTYTEFSEIEHLVNCAEEELAELDIPKTQRTGAVWYQTSGSAVANSYYGNQRNATTVKLERKRSGWYLAAVSSATVYKEGGGRGKLYLPKKVAELALARFSEKLNVL